MDLNHVTLTGRLKRNPISKASDTGTPLVTFTVECQETNATGTTFTLFVPCEAYGEAAEISKVLHAGDSVLVAGKLKWTSYTAKDGTKRSTLCLLTRKHATELEELLFTHISADGAWI